MKTSNTSNRLKEIMQKKGLRQVDILRLAEPFCKKYNIKLGRNDLSQYISGKAVPGQDKLTVLGLALNVTETWLLGYDDEFSKECSNFDSNLLEKFYILDNNDKKIIIDLIDSLVKKYGMTV